MRLMLFRDSSYENIVLCWLILKMLFETAPDYIASCESCFSIKSYPFDASSRRKTKMAPKELSHLDTSNMPVNSLRMLGLTFTPDLRPRSKTEDSWTPWVQYIKSHDPSLCIKDAALLHKRTGLNVAATKGFVVSTEEAKQIRELFYQNRTMPEYFQCADRTYCIKSITDKAIVAFHGGSYLIVSQTQKLIIVAVCNSRTKAQEARAFIEKCSDKLSKTS